MSDKKKELLKNCKPWQSVGLAESGRRQNGS